MRQRGRFSAAEELFAFQAKAARLPIPTREHHFHATRRWRFDFAWVEQKLALEIEGGVWSNGRHTRPYGFAGDVEKYNHAVLLGWRVIRATSLMVRSGEALRLVEKVLKGSTT